MFKKPTSTPSTSKLPLLSQHAGPSRLPVNKQTSITKQTPKPPVSKAPMLRRRSKSVSDLRSLTVNKENTFLARNAIRTAVKRPAPPLSTVQEAKVASKPKQPKLAPYDYKGRYNLIKERYTELKANYDEDKIKLKKLDVFEKMEIELKELKDKNEILQKDTENYLEKCNKLEEELNALKPAHESLVNKHEKASIELQEFKVENQKLVGEINVLKAEILLKDQANTELLDKLSDLDNLRRKIHEELQSLKGNIRVMCRVRPPRRVEENEPVCVIESADECSISVKKYGSQDSSGDFVFDHVFLENAKQFEVFEELAPLIQSALDGYHVCVFAYGQTGSGKTYTMQGGEDEEEQGVIPRAINFLFNCIKQYETSGWEFQVFASFIEIYNESPKDLLNPNSDNQMSILYNDGKGVLVTNLICEHVKSAQQLLHLMTKAHRNRATAATDFNEHSSRSHAVTKITIESCCPARSSKFCSSLNFVDLAGSERLKEATGERSSEARYINRSLSALSNVIRALQQKDSHIPYRNSKLTYLLQSSLGGNSKTMMFVNVSPLERSYSESLNSLRFAKQVKDVKIVAKRSRM